MEEKVWITQAPGCGVIEKTSTYERGTYYFFDAQNWRKVVKEFYLDYSKLENQPNLPTASSALYHVVWPIKPHTQTQIYTSRIQTLIFYLKTSTLFQFHEKMEPKTRLFGTL